MKVVFGLELYLVFHNSQDMSRLEPKNCPIVLFLNY